ncbi:MAG: hypothetical protein C0490_01735 [Marivirga sp.]|nr:hypothetical protein [Marivirga sp.]
MLEEDILAGLKNGNEKVLDELFTRYYVKLARYALRQLNDSMVAEEIVQDTFIYLWKKRSSLNVETSLEAYLYKAVANKCINYIKSKVRRMNRLTSDEDVSNSAVFKMVDLETKELHQLIELALKSLPQQTAMIYSFSRNTGLTFVEIAEKLDVSQKTIEYHISSALRLMRNILQKYGYVFPISVFLDVCI